MKRRKKSSVYHKSKGGLVKHKISPRFYVSRCYGKSVTNYSRSLPKFAELRGATEVFQRRENPTRYYNGRIDWRWFNSPPASQNFRFLKTEQQSRVPHATSSPKYPVSAHRGWMLLIVCLGLSVFPSWENIPRQNCSDALRPRSCSTRTPVSRLLTNTGRRRELSNHLPDRRGLLTSTIDHFHLPWRPARRVGISKLPAEQHSSSWPVARANSSLANGAPASPA